MSRVVQTQCPGCQKVLRVPAEWLGKSLRCKHCGLLVKTKTPTKDNTETVSPLPAPASKAPASAPAPAPLTDLSVDSSEPPIIRKPKVRRRSATQVWFGLTFGVAGLAAVVVIAVLAWDSLVGVGQQLRDTVLEGGAGDQSTPKASTTAATGPVVHPRRALVVCVSNYLYANPVSYGGPTRNVHSLTEKMANALHLPPDQVLELSDSVPAGAPLPAERGRGKRQRASKTVGLAEPKPRPPLKPVIEKAVTDFLDSSRAQDRLLLLFVGHVVTIDDAGYLVPLEGELTVKETLIPLSWLLDRLEKCKARQKVLVLDTCRFDPGRGLERPGSGPMSAKLDALLQKPPAGVQIWRACSADEYSYEFEGVGVFLDKLADSLNPKVLKEQGPQDALLIKNLAEEADTATAKEVESQQKAKQTPKLAGEAPADGAIYNKDEAAPPKLALPELPPTEGGYARPADVRSILQEIEVPPLRLAREDATPLQLEDLVPFSQKALEPYRPDGRAPDENRDAKRFPIRAAVVQAIELMRKHGKAPLRELFSGTSNDKIKQDILKEQEGPARVMGELMAELDELREAGKKREEEKSKRWLAHYDYVLAQLLARTVYLSEYNLMLGKIRKDELPTLEAGQTGYRLASRQNPQGGKEYKDMATESRKILEKVANEHKGTPWEVLAKRDSLAALGLEWQPVR